MKMVKFPRSRPKVPSQMRWEAIRWSSPRRTRMYSARSGTLIPASLSTART
jgi:hypothetical protein